MGLPCNSNNLSILDVVSHELGGCEFGMMPQITKRTFSSPTSPSMITSSNPAPTPQ